MHVGFVMGNPQVRNFHTVTRTHIHRTCSAAVSYETYGITNTHGILIIKIIITITLQYVK